MTINKIMARWYIVSSCGEWLRLICIPIFLLFQPFSGSRCSTEFNYLSYGSCVRGPYVCMRECVCVCLCLFLHASRTAILLNINKICTFKISIVGCSNDFSRSHSYFEKKKKKLSSMSNVDTKTKKNRKTWKKKNKYAMLTPPDAWRLTLRGLF